MYEIEKNIPIPEAHRGKNQFPFPEMEVGDSFLVTKIGGENSAKVSMRHYTLTHDWKFVSRQTPEGLRIWRVK